MVDFNPEWLTRTVQSMMNQALFDRSLLPIVADALEDAHCDSQYLIEYCRTGSSARHVAAIVLGAYANVEASLKDRLKKYNINYDYFLKHSDKCQNMLMSVSDVDDFKAILDEYETITGTVFPWVPSSDEDDDDAYYDCNGCG